MLQHYEEEINVQMATCGMTNLPVRTAFLIDEEYKCCNDFIPITYEEALKLEKILLDKLILRNGAMREEIGLLLQDLQILSKERNK